MGLFYKGGEETSRARGKAYKTAADASGCYFLDASKYLQASKVDGVHLDPPAHRILAMETKKMVAPILAQATGKATSIVTAGPPPKRPLQRVRRTAPRH
jgi:hypothetical protein